MVKLVAECQTIPDFAAVNDKGAGSGDNWNSNTCKAPVNLPQTNSFYRPDAIPVMQPTMAKHSRAEHPSQSISFINISLILTTAQWCFDSIGWATGRASKHPAPTGPKVYQQPQVSQ